MSCGDQEFLLKDLIADSTVDFLVKLSLLLHLCIKESDEIYYLTWCCLTWEGL